MSTEKKVIFTGQDNGVNQKVNQIYGGLLAKSKEYSASLKEQTSYIEKQVKELEKKARLDIKTGTSILKEQEALFREARSPKDRSRYEERVNRVKSELSDSTAVLETLKELLSETKRQANTSQKTEKEYSKKLRLEEDRYQSQKSLWRQEVQYDKDGVRKRIRSAEKSDYRDMSPDQVEKLMYQKTITSGGDKDKSIFGQVFAGTLAAGIVQKIGSFLGTVVHSETGEQAFNSILGGIPGIGGFLSGAEQRSFNEQYAVGSGVKKLKAKTGNFGLSIGGNTDMGYSTKENVEYASSLIESSGNGAGYNKYGNQARLLERGVGLSPQLINQLVKDIRTTGSSADLLKVASYVINANPELKRDQTKFSEILSQTSALTNQLASQTENSNLRNNAGVVGSLRSIGGSFADPVLGPQRMMSINQSLTSPGNDFQKSRSFGVLSGLKPGMSYFQMLEAQEKGIGQEGYLEGIVKQLEKETGGGENLMLAVQQNLGLGASTSRRLVEARGKNPNLFKNFKGGNEDIENMLGLSSRSVELTSKKDSDAAKLADEYLKGAFSGITESLKQTGDVMLDGAVKFAGQLTSILLGFGSVSDLKKNNNSGNVTYNE